MKYRINAPRIVFEQIEGETILIDFDSGTYYSIGTVGSDLIRWIGDGMEADEVVACAQRRYAGSAEAIENGVRAFVAELMQESILVETNGAPSLEGKTGGAIPSVPPPFEAPSLQKYTDMKDLLLLDPIHEVDEMGWPKEKPEA
jgi:hypothetical protein